MKTLVYAALATVMASCVTQSTQTEHDQHVEVEAQGSTEKVVPFQLAFEITEEDMLKMLCKSGCDWKETAVSFSQGNTQYITNTGVFHDETKLHLSGDAFAFTLTPSEPYSVALTAIKGCQWTELTGTSEPSGRFAVDEKGISLQH